MCGWTGDVCIYSHDDGRRKRHKRDTAGDELAEEPQASIQVLDGCVQDEYRDLAADQDKDRGFVYEKSSKMIKKANEDDEDERKDLTGLNVEKHNTWETMLSSKNSGIGRKHPSKASTVKKLQGKFAIRAIGSSHGSDAGTIVTQPIVAACFPRTY